MPGELSAELPELSVELPEVEVSVEVDDSVELPEVAVSVSPLDVEVSVELLGVALSLELPDTEVSLLCRRSMRESNLPPEAGKAWTDATRRARAATFNDGILIVNFWFFFLS